MWLVAGDLLAHLLDIKESLITAFVPSTLEAIRLARAGEKEEPVTPAPFGACVFGDGDGNHTIFGSERSSFAVSM